MIEKLEPASTYYQQALQLLKDNHLPTDDINHETSLYGYTQDHKILGTIGIEIYSGKALLRSLAVNENARSAGIGNNLIKFIEDYAKRKGVNQLVLLTTTAANYFAKRNYSIIERANIPNEVKQSAEFKSTCPTSATTMIKTL